MKTINRLLAIITVMVLALAAEAGAGQYELDPAHTQIGFSVVHMVITNVKGAFGAFKGSFTVDDSNSLVAAEAEIQTQSINTGIEKRDNHLRSADFFDAPRFVFIKFKSTGVTRAADGTYTVTGDITIRDVTKPITLTGKMAGPVKDPWGYTRMGFSATGTLDRKDFGLTWNQAIETGGMLVGDTVTIVLEGEGILQK